MALVYNATFRPERRKKNGMLITSNVPILLDLCFHGRRWYNTGFRLLNIEDFDTTKEKLISGKKAIKNDTPISATNMNIELNGIKGYIQQVFSTAQALGTPISAKYLIDEMKVLSGNSYSMIDTPSYFKDDFSNWIDRMENKGIIGKGRRHHYDGVASMVERFQKIYKLKLKTSSFNPDVIDKFRQFIFDEHAIAPLHKELYPKGMPSTRTQNTVASLLKMLKSFFTSMEELNVISVSPFTKIGKRERSAILRQVYDEAYYLTINELLMMINTEVPENLNKVRKTFLLQIATGCRIEEFNALSWANIETALGFYVVHYVSSKTSHQNDLVAIDTPLVAFAAKIIEENKECGLLCPSFKGNVSGENGYNKQIKALLRHYKINRSIIVRKKGELVTVPICELASSKLARKTHVDITTKTSLNKYMSGLHSSESDAVDHYTGMNITEKFYAYCQAFKQDPYNLKTPLISQ